MTPALAESVMSDLFCKYYHFCGAVTKEVVLQKRSARFELDPYWKIWKEYGKCFAFLEGFFHKQNGQNQLDKIPESDKMFFTDPAILLRTFETSDKLAIYFQRHGIRRMVNVISEEIILACNKLVAEFNNNVPRTRHELMMFSGYGRKIANMLLNCAFDQPTIAIDVRVYRSALALGLLPKEFIGRFSSDSFKFEAELILEETLRHSDFLIEADYLLFCAGGEK